MGNSEHGSGAGERTLTKEIHTPNCKKRKMGIPQDHTLAQETHSLSAQGFRVGSAKSLAQGGLGPLRMLGGRVQSWGILEHEDPCGHTGGRGGGRVHSDIRAQSRGARGGRQKAGTGMSPG